MIEIVQTYPPLFETEPDRVYRRLARMLDTVEAFFLDAADNAAILHQHGRGIVARAARKQVVATLMHEVETTRKPEGQHSPAFPIQRRRGFSTAGGILVRSA